MMQESVVARVEERNGVHVISVNDMTAIESSRSAVIGQIKRIRNGVEVVANLVDLVRPGISQLQRQAMPVLHAQPGLERVVGEIGFVLLDRDASKSRKLSNEVRVQLSTLYGLANGVWCCRCTVVL